MKRTILSAAFLIAVTSLLPAAGDLELRDQTQEITYNPTVGTELIGALEVYHKGAAAEYFLTLSTGQSGSFAFRLLTAGANTLEYQIYDDAMDRNVIKDLSTGPGQNEVLYGSAEENSGGRRNKIQIPYLITIPPGQLLAGDTYSDALTVSLYTGSIDAPTLESTATLTISGPVANSISLALVDPGGSVPTGGVETNRTLDFGELTTGAVRAVDLLVEANCAFTVALQSDNGGFMAHTDTLDPSVVAYELLLAGSPVDLRSADSVTVATSPGFRYPLEFVIGDLGTPSSGTYQDVITITVSAQ